jgi:hypothetical protein
MTSMARCTANRTWVGSKYVNRGKSTCYGLALDRAGSSPHHLNLCVEEAFHEATPAGARLQVRGRRSWYGNQVLSYGEEP